MLASLDRDLQCNRITGINSQIAKGDHMRSLIRIPLFAFASFGCIATALADEPARKPTFALMDNTGEGSEVNVEVAASVATRSPLDAVILRPRLLVQHVAPNGIGGYASISASTRIPDASLATSSLGNLELGGLYQHTLSPDVDLGFRVGLVLPTATDNYPQVVSTVIARPTDLATAAPGITWLRLGLSPTYHRGPFVLRADLGMDLPGSRVATAGFAHTNLGVGIEHNRFSVTAELQAGAFLTTTGDISAFKTAGLAARYQGKVSPYVAVSTPLGDWFRGEAITVTTGLTVPF